MSLTLQYHQDVKNGQILLTHTTDFIPSTITGGCSKVNPPVSEQNILEEDKYLSLVAF